MLYWQFRTLNPNDNSGASTAEDNFAQEERTNVDILVRESIQNPLDARAGDALVDIRFRWLALETSRTFAKHLFAPNWRTHLLYAGVQAPGMGEKIPFLAIEDYGTTGLCGTYTDSAKEGRAENWNAFWFREGEGVKPTKANGGAGQGKLTLYLASTVRTLAALTYRISDRKWLLAGGCRFGRNYSVDGERFAREARWGNTGDASCLSEPSQNEELLGTYEKELGLDRSGNPGTSFLIPFPDPEITPESVKLALLNEFYFPILRQRLSVTVHGQTVSSATVASLAEERQSSLRTPARYRSFLASIAAPSAESATPDATADAPWERDAKLTVDVFGTETVDKLRAKFDQGETVEVGFPVRITSSVEGEQVGHMRVFLRQVEDPVDSYELFIRQDLAIDKERTLARARKLVPAMALTLIEDSELSRFLAMAEEPTHREWNARRPRLTNSYHRASQTLRSVRNAAARLLDLLAPAAEKDSSALAAYFPDFSSVPTPQTGAPKKKAVAVGPTSDVVRPPPARSRKVDLRALDDGAMVKADSAAVTAADLPLQCRLELAYGTEFGNAFAQWDAADFYLSDRSQHVDMHGVDEVSYEGNKVSFSITSPGGWFVIAGFDTNRQLEMRLTYKESADAGHLAHDESDAR
jgi:hypothetical protein